MAQEATVRLRLNTRQAKAELRDLNKEARKSSGRITSGIRRAVGSGMGAVGLGGGIGLGLAAARGATQSGFGDVIGESFGAIGAQLNDFFLGDMDDKSRAIRKAREETIAAFGFQAGAKEGIPDGAKQFFDNRVSEFTQEEIGRSIFEKNEDFRGPAIDDILSRITTSLGELLSQAVNDLADRLAFWR